MDRPEIGNPARVLRSIYSILIAAILFSQSLDCAAQLPPSAAEPRTTVQPPHPVSGLLQPSIDSVHQALTGLRIDRWKKGTVRDEASTNIDSIQGDLRVNLPPLLQGADTTPGTVSKLLPLSRHVDALYDVLLRVVEASRVAAPDDQAAQLQQALVGLGAARLTLDDHIKGSAEAMEKQVADLRALIQQQAAQRQVAPVAVALPCVPPAPTKTIKKARKPAPKPSTTTSATPAKPSPNQ